MKITIARVAGSPARVSAALDLAARSLEDAGWEVTKLDIPSREMPADLNDEERHLASSFTLTPGALIESWRIARHLENLTAPGDTLLISDYRGIGGVFTLEQDARAQDERRVVWTLAGESTSLAHLDTLGTVGGFDGETKSAIDWEIVQYRFSQVVLSPAEQGVVLLEKIGVDAIAMPIAASTATALQPVPNSAIWLPEAVSRISRTPTIMRGLVSVLEQNADRTVAMSSEDEQDEIWEGTTWERVAALCEQEGIRVLRESEDPGGTIVLGNALAVPDPAVVEAHNAGRPILVPADSTAAAMMPAALVWTNEDDLGSILLGPTVSEARKHGPERSWPNQARLEDAARARAVSVGIPVYRDIRFLDECIQSVLDQSQRPHEVILFDDGSSSADVDAALDAWTNRHPGLIRVMRGPNRGVCVARNKMLDVMGGDSFLLVDSDDVLHPEFIEATASMLRSTSSLTAVATWTEFFGGYNGVEAKPPFDVRVGLRENPIISTAVLVDMSIRDDEIRFAPDLAFLYCEDWHVWSQIVAAGGTFGLVPRALVRHRVHPSSGATRRTALALTVGQARATQPIRWGDLP